MRFGTTHWLSGKFGNEYPRALRAQFARFGHRLTVLGNSHESDESLATGLQGWHAKLEWFAPWNAHLRPAVVFDLDTFILADPAPFLELDPSRLWMIREFLGKDEKRRSESGIFVAPTDEALCTAIWSRAQTWTGPDGHLLRQFPHGRMPDLIPGILSYKADQLYDRVPDRGVVCCFHGLPKPANAKGWAKDFWLSFLN